MTLTLTETASNVVETIVAQSGAESGGLRIQEAGDQFAIAVAETATPQEQVVEAGGARVFLDETAATALDDKVLDARVADDGSVQFALALQG